MDMINVPNFHSPKHTRLRIFAARAIAMTADAIQIALLPFFAEGAASPVNDVLDVLVAVAMFWLLGFNWAFLPSIVAEMIPFVDLAPTWTIAVFFATRKGATPAVQDNFSQPGVKPVESKVVG